MSNRRFTLTAADLFCGAGGMTSGLIRAARRRGLKVDVLAVNHWQVAVDTHSANHPDVRHLCESLDNVDPRKVVPGGRLGILCAGPECTHHSVARGGKPCSDQSRASAWHVLRWAEALWVDAILVENVREFRDWGPLGRNGRPLKSKRGRTYRAFLQALESLGYKVEDRVLNCADFGDPTTRKRLFVMCRKRGAINWPEPSHAGQWRAAREVIDWSLPSQSIFERNRPLSPKTMRRIFAGLEKFGLRPFLVPGKYTDRPGERPRVHGIDYPLSTVTACGHIELVEPFLLKMRGGDDSHIKSSSHSIDSPVPTITAGGRQIGLVSPFLVQVAHGNGSDPQGDRRRVKSIEEPLATVCGRRGEWALCEPSLLPQQSGGQLRSVENPVPTVATAGAIGLVEPFLIKYYGNSGGARSIHDPLDTLTTKPRYGLVKPVISVDGSTYQLDVRFRMLQPAELAAAQGFPSDYKFCGNKTETVRQIGNAVPVNTAAALIEELIR